MERRSWPWKKKSSDKSAPTTHVSSHETSVNQGDQGNSKNVVSYVQLPRERYAQLSEMEDKVKLLNGQICTAHSDLSTKDTSIKQHTKVAEEAVSGWEKAEAEALALKTQLESVTLLKLAAEEQVVHLDGALKERIKQIRTEREESEQKLHDVVFAKTKQLEKVKHEHEAKINAFEQELVRAEAENDAVIIDKTRQWEQIKHELEEKINIFEQEYFRASAENDALSRSLQERSNMLMKISDEKAQAETDIEVLKANIEACEKELNSMKYEVHIVSKELEIRNEEKNMCARSADVANKHRLDDVKKIAKLEAECQRLRGLVRKKLPGPAALAQMKLEVESLGRDYGESRLRRSPVKSGSPHLPPIPDFALENIQHYQKENEFLTARLLATEEETNMLKEALSKRNSELQDSRIMYAKTDSKLRGLESQMVVLNHQRSPSKSSIDISNERNIPNLISMSEDGNDEDGSCAEVSSASKAGSTCLELMDDFLEMERLACLSAENSKPVSSLDGIMDKTKTENPEGTSLVASRKDADIQKADQSCTDKVLNNDIPSLSKIQSKIALIFEQAKDADVGKLLQNIRHLVQEIEEEMPQKPINCLTEEVQLVDSEMQRNGDIANNTSCIDEKSVLSEDVMKAILQIHDFVLLFIRSSDPDGLAQKVGELSVVMNKVLSSELCVNEFIITLSDVFSESNETVPRIFGDKEGNSPDCIDKVTLLENKTVQHEGGKDRFSDSSSDAEIFPGRSVPDVEKKGSLERHSLEEFELLKVERDGLADDLAKCTERLEQTKSQLFETEQNLDNLKSQLDASQKSNGLAETQLKCMAESYRTLELRSNEVENEIKLLQTKTEALDLELKEERFVHQEDLAKYMELTEERNAKCSVSSETDAEIKSKQEMEIAAASDKLAECQETILLLGRQLKSMHPQTDFASLLPYGQINVNDFSEDVLSTSDSNLNGFPNTQFLDHTENENTASLQRSGRESSFEGYGDHSPSHTDADLVPKTAIDPELELSKPRSSRSTPASDEKQGRGGGSFARFFSKGKSNNL